MHIWCTYQKSQNIIKAVEEIFELNSLERIESDSEVSSDESLYNLKTFTAETEASKEWSDGELNMIKFLPQNFSKCEFRKKRRADPLRGCADCTYYGTRGHM